MKENELRLLFESGRLQAAAIVPYLLTSEWCLQLEIKGSSPVLMDAQRSSPRRFKSLDAAFKAAKSLGFRMVEVHA